MIIDDLLVALRAARQARGLLIREVAAQVGVTTKLLGHWERGRIVPPRARLVTWAGLLAVPMPDHLDAPPPQGACSFAGCTFPLGRFGWGLCYGHEKQRCREGGVLRPLPKLPNRIEVRGDEALIHVTAARGTRLASIRVDASDVHELESRQWGVHDGRPRASGTKSLMLYNLLMVPPEGMIVDHLDGDTLNNRRSNLRLVTPAQNSQNVAIRGRAESRNCHWDGARQGWNVRVRVGGSLHHGGFFARIEEARAAARELRARVMPFANEARHAGGQVAAL
jgi:transcriptional regulator with XRE-family HTH domain